MDNIEGLHKKITQTQFLKKLYGYFCIYKTQTSRPWNKQNMVKEDKRYITKRKMFITHKHQELIALKCEKLLKSVWTMIYNLIEILI